MLYTVLTATLSAFLSVAWTALAEEATRFGHAKILQRGSQIDEAYDYVIVGAGTAGLTLADRLSADGKYAVLVIEYCYPISDETIARSDGRNFLDPGISYNISSIPQVNMNNRKQAVIIGCCVGGSSAINGMVFVRGTKPEYDGWAELGGPGSTWNWEGVLPYFKKASHFNPPTEEMARNFNVTWNPDVWGQDPANKLYASYPNYGIPSIIPFYKAMAKMRNMPIPEDGASGKSGLFWNPTSMDNKNYWRSYSRTAHFDGIARKNYHIITMHKVKRILFNGTTATGVQFSPRDTDQILTVIAKREVIISAGTVHTPQILQNSGIGPKDLLQQAKIPVLIDLPGVGQNFQDHAFLSVNYQWGVGTGPVLSNITQSGNASTIAGPNLGAWIGLPTMTDDFEKIASRYESQDAAQYLPKNTHLTVLAGYRAFKKLHAKLLRSTDSNWLWLPLFGTPGGIVMSMHVVSHGTINIDPENPDAEPIVDYRALSNPIDMDIMVENIRYMRKFLKSEEFAPWKPTETAPGIEIEGEELREWIRKVLIPTNFHPIATAAKMPKEMGGVVDEQLRVHGTKRLRVVDGSIMPLLPGANTQQSVYMIAEKAVDLIKAEQR
ncbi:GMC oxidoreductase [Melanomma pulvis-pyrius CBS 109.77]|uniref:GMC oxidoreductase n=1 Tax=Melanomma pulvis-pyrius CBS 109.77 TaxID=1314802 RepID=A0A6A6WY35_9PLEO|nr:GMC oxidoreductase [Melanomma pulvis-pyrius CBS 109.77]